MCHIIKLAGFAITCCITAIAAAQVGSGVVDSTIRIPRDTVFGDALVPAGSYELSLVEIDRETWFVLTKYGKEVVRDLAVEMSAREYPMQGLKTEVLRGEEYFRWGGCWPGPSSNCVTPTDSAPSDRLHPESATSSGRR